MAFVDEIKLHLKAGDGGDGVVRWLHEKGKEFGGPAGGDGGDGGDVYITGVRDIGLLNRYRQIKSIYAEKGDAGGSKGMRGKNGTDLRVHLPLGSLVTNLTTLREYDLTEEGKDILVLSGGRGGKGNIHFKSSTNIRPRQFTTGKIGDESNFHIELRLIADVGVIGLPNAGKSSLLNVLTRANAKVGSYQFTTLEPNLGDFHGFVLADIPGLIEGASEGRGLGHKFLRHIRRTKLLLHCVSLQEKDVLSAYDAVRKELVAYSPELADKKEVVVLTKTDEVTPAELKKATTKLKKRVKHVLSVSVIDDDKLKQFTKSLLSQLKKL